MTQEINPKTGKKYYYKDNPESVKKRKESQMWVNGKYIPMAHPLHKPGRYSNFNDAAFTSLQKDVKVKEGYVYAISNPAWPDWIKIGMAIDAEDRLNGYQTSSPMRDYELIHSVYFDDRNKAERLLEAEKTEHEKNKMKKVYIDSCRFELDFWTSSLDKTRWNN